MVHSNDDDTLIQDDVDCSFFDFCQHHKLSMVVTHKTANKIERIEGYVTGFQQNTSMVSLRGRQGFDYVLPLKDILLVTIKGRNV